MYTPNHFRIDDTTAALRIVHEYPFATVITAHDGAVETSFLPCIVVAREPHLVIGAHFARANPHWRAVEAAGTTLLFHGPHGYISPRWYAEPRCNVPTWNYAVVRASASARIVAEDELRALVDALAAHLEGGSNDAWTVGGADPAYIAGQIKGIVGVHFTVTALDAKFKLSQNRDAIDREGAIDGLRNSAQNGDALANLMVEGALR